MNQEQAISLFRTALQVAMTALITKGLISSDQAESLTTALLTAGPALVLTGTTIWSIYVRRKAGLVAAAAALPDVQKVVAAPKLAAAVPDAKVVALGQA